MIVLGQIVHTFLRATYIIPNTGSISISPWRWSWLFEAGAWVEHLRHSLSSKSTITGEEPFVLSAGFSLLKDLFHPPPHPTTHLQAIKLRIDSYDMHWNWQYYVLCNTVILFETVQVKPILYYRELKCFVPCAYIKNVEETEWRTRRETGMTVSKGISALGYVLVGWFYWSWGVFICLPLKGDPQYLIQIKLVFLSHIHLHLLNPHTTAKRRWSDYTNTCTYNRLRD